MPGEVRHAPRPAGHHGHGQRQRPAATSLTAADSRRGGTSRTSNSNARPAATAQPQAQPPPQPPPQQSEQQERDVVPAAVEKKEDKAPPQEEQQQTKQEEQKTPAPSTVEPERPAQQKAPKDYKKSNVTPTNFNVREFNTNMTEFVRTLEDPRYSIVDSDYPVDELTKVVGLIAVSVSDYRNHAQEASGQLENVRAAMRTIKENLHFSVSRQAMDLRAEQGSDTQEEKDLFARLSKLNADLAKANSDVTEAIRLATETESAAVKADITAEKGREEALRLQAEIEMREKHEKLRREEERRRMEEEKRKKAEEEKKAQEELRRKEEEWSRREAQQTDKPSNVYDNWEPIQFEVTNETGENEVMCIARGQPGSFNKSDVKVEVANDSETSLTYLPNEELISRIVDLKSSDGETELKNPIFVAIPHVLNRSSGQSREPVVKAMMAGQWTDVPTQDVTFDSHKDTRFAQAEVRHLTSLLVMSRLKRDYSTLQPTQSHKLKSSCDQRVTLTIEPATFTNKEYFMLQVQPIDSGIFQEFRTRHPQGKTLLTSSPIVHTKWDTCSLQKPILFTVPCPPNPAKAKKMALARQLKDEKMKNPIKRGVEIPIDARNQENEKKKERQREQMKALQSEAEGEVAPKPTKWYMGDYANFDDDETDRLFFAFQAGKKWRIHTDMDFKQIKVDLLAFNMEFPVEKFVVLRTRPSVDEDQALALVCGLDNFLGKRFVQAVIRQRSDNPFDVMLQITPVSKREAVVSQLTQKGFESGPAPSHILCLHEGDIVEVGFSGNIEAAPGSKNGPEQLVYKSNVPTLAYFTVQEQNKFRQKDNDYFSGLLVLTRKYVDPNTAHARTHGHKGDEESVPPEIVWKSERLCALQVNIPKYHVDANSAPVRATVTPSGQLSQKLLDNLAGELGDEWRRLAQYLGVRRARIQSIMRNVAVGEQDEKYAKYEMLLTWLKGATKYSDKLATLSTGLIHVDREDLASAILMDPHLWDTTTKSSKGDHLHRQASSVSEKSTAGL